MFREHFLEALRVQVIFVQELQVQDSARLSFYQQQNFGESALFVSRLGRARRLNRRRERERPTSFGFFSRLCSVRGAKCDE
jgi:hypothetical protein